MYDRTNIVTVFILVFIVYFLSSYPSVSGGDSGELLAESCSAGTAHPPGYPSYLLSSRLFNAICFIPRISFDKFLFDYQPTFAWRCNVLNCLFGAVSAAFIGQTSVTLLNLWNCRFKNNIIVTHVTAFLSAFSPLMFEYSIQSEVFALNNAIISILLFLTIKLSDFNINSSEISKYLYFGSFFSGLALSNQHASLLTLLIIIPFVIILTFNKVIILKNFIIIIFSFLFGLSPYIYLIIVAKTPNRGSWGDLTTFSGVIRHGKDVFYFITNIILNKFTTYS
jgi:hypothetical protein